MRMVRAAVLPLALLLAGSLAGRGQQWSVTNTLHIGGEGGWDYVTVDAASHRLFVTRSTHTQVIDAASGKVLGDIPGQKRSHGVALVPSLNRGFITDGGGDGAIIVFDLKTYAVLGKLATMPDSDGIIYDPGQNLVLAVSGDKGMLMMFKPDIDPNSGKVDTVDLGGSPEFLTADGTGKAYINLEDKDTVAEVDLASHKVIARWPVAPGGHPVGLALDKKSHRLFIGCRNPQKLVIMSTTDGKVLGSVDIGAGVDATQIDGRQAFASCRDGKLIVAAEKSGNYAAEQTVTTPDGARTMGLDTSAHKLYLPTAEFEPAAAGARPKMKPDTFEIVEVSRK
ncbi:MAG TPA: YncE family protein [Terracidiphilus sp.]|nr:YncE family protein [Terracidiphilus sp.]